MLILRGVIAGILLFLGRELNFLFAATMAAFIGLRLTPLLPTQWPWWSDYAFMAVLASIPASITFINDRVGFFWSGFLAGGYFLIEYYEPNFLTVPLIPFLFGGVIGSLTMGFLKDWGLMFVTCAMGAYYVTNLFRLSANAQILVASGLFVIGAITQVI